MKLKTRTNQPVEGDEIENLKVDNLVVEDSFSAPYEEIANVTISNSWLNGITAKNVYGKLIKENNILYFVLSFRLTNETESTLATLDGATITNYITTVPTSISSKIYRKDGTTCDEALVSGDDITGASLKLSGPTAGGVGSKICNFYSSEPNTFSLYANANTGAISLLAGESIDVDCRFFLVL